MHAKEVTQSAPVDESVPLLDDSRLEVPSEVGDDAVGRAHWAGYLLATVASGFFGSSVTCIKTATSDGQLLSSEVVHFSSLIMSSIAIVSIALNRSARRSLTALTRKQIAAAVLRGLVGAVNVLLLYKAIQLIPAGQADASYFVTPAFTMLVSAVFLREKVHLADGLLAVASIVGVLLISSPAFAPNNFAQSHSENSDFQQNHLLGVFCALLAAFFNACGMVLTRSLSKRVHYLHLVFLFGVWGVLLTMMSGHAVNLVSVRERYPKAFFAVLAAGVMVTTAQILIHASLNFIPAGRASLIRNCEVPIVYVTAVCFLSERLSVLPLLGSVIVVTSAVVIGLRQIFQRQHQ